MMLRPVLVALATFTAFPLGLAAQDSLLLRYHPVAGVKVHRVFQSHTRITGVGAAGEAAGPAREAADLGGVTEVALPGPDGALIVHLAYDSLRARMREGDESWREYEVTALDSLWLQVSLDSRMRVVEATAGGDRPGSGMLLHLLTGAPGMELPGGWLRQGQYWSSRLEFQLGELVGHAPVEAPSALLGMEMDFRLDSLTARDQDTLAYIRYSGALTPTTLRREDGSTHQFAGATMGTLVWSTGWRGWVAAAVRLQVVVSVPERGRLSLETTVRQSVLP
ncbi:MAG: hypothetical protein JSW43_11920 [Gemmatimonadota bacterium]|nr:MAG: hypothetical protein JSW43_11920 [Gemmatimonadota bacterium]